MSRLHIVAPALLDALSEGCAAGDPSALRMARQCARGDFTAGSDRSIDAEVLALFGADESCALAGVTAASDFDLDHVPQDLVRADPVHLRADPSRVILFDADSVGLDADEADALLACLNAVFTADGVEFMRGRSPRRWYMRGLAAPALALASPRSLRGQPIEACLEELRKSGALRRVSTEAQMILFEAAVNVAREQGGRGALNSVWFWGAGPAPALEPGGLDAVFGDDDLLAACARQAGIAHHRDLSGVAAMLASGAALAVVLSCETAAFDLTTFERTLWLPALRGLRRGAPRALTLSMRGGRLQLSRASTWRWWRRRGPFVARLRQLREAARAA